MPNSPQLSPKHVGLVSSSDPELRKLSEYEAVYGGSVATHMLVFTELSATPKDAQDGAASMALTLKDFAKWSIVPVVILEPTVQNKPVDLSAYRSGSYDHILDAYFQALKANGISDKTLGTWVFMPEGNTPRWQDTDPGDFSASVIKTVGYLKKYFPAGKASILLDSQTYQSDDTNWEHGVYQSLAPYVEGIPRGVKYITRRDWSHSPVQVTSRTG